MSVDRSAVIVRVFIIDENPYTDDRFADDFIDDWVICFDSWDSAGPFILGYYVQRACEEGMPFELTSFMGNKDWDDNLREACEDAGIEVKEIKTYFGVRVS